MDSHTMINITKPFYDIYKNIMLYNTINTFERHLYSQLIRLICDWDLITGNLYVKASVKMPMEETD